VKQIPELNGLRGAAFLFVFLFHTLRLPPTHFLPNAANAICRSGWLGVDLFFVLSGFLITGILLGYREELDRYRIFYTRRVLRIFPIYYLVVLFVFFVTPVFSDFFLPLEQLKLYFLTYTYNFWIVFTDTWAKVGALDHFWSLCIEEQFYLVWPFIIFTLANRNLKRFCVFVFLLSLCMKISIAARVDDWFVIYVFPLGRLEGFASGAFVAILHEEGFVRRNRHTVLIALLLSAVLLALGIILDGFHMRDRAVVAGIPAIASLFFASLIYLLIAEGDTLMKKLMRNRVLTLFGRYSYGLYVYHYIIWYVLVSYFSLARKAMSTSLVVMVVSLPISILSYHLYEKMFLRLKYRKAVWPHFH
jgi:peptidoglycan/LPS O-acetylase OafA/YrhL